MEQRQSFRHDKDPQIAGQMTVQGAKRRVQKKSWEVQKKGWKVQKKKLWPLEKSKNEQKMDTYDAIATANNLKFHY